MPLTKTGSAVLHVRTDLLRLLLSLSEREGGRERERERH